MTKNKPSDVLDRMRATTTRPKPVSTAPQETPRVQDAPENPAPPPAPPRARRVRYTLDLEPEQHKNLKRFALEAEADASEVMRALLALLHTDTGVRNAVLTAISKD